MTTSQHDWPTTVSSGCTIGDPQPRAVDCMAVCTSKGTDPDPSAPAPAHLTSFVVKRVKN